MKEQKINFTCEHNTKQSFPVIFPAYGSNRVGRHNDFLMRDVVDCEINEIGGLNKKNNALQVSFKCRILHLRRLKMPDFLRHSLDTIIFYVHSNKYLGSIIY